MTTEAEYTIARDRMVREQLAARGIVDPRVLEAFRKVPRHVFVPWEVRRGAYLDHPLPIGSGQTISQPYMVATMLQVLAAAPGHKVLELGTGSGYQTALLRELAQSVYTIERLPELLERARTCLEGLGYADVAYRAADGTAGWPEAAPFDRILVSAGAPRVPAALTEQLAIGGRLVIPVGSRDEQMLCTIDKRADGTLDEQPVCACVFVPLVGHDGWSEGARSE